MNTFVHKALHIIIKRWYRICTISLFRLEPSRQSWLGSTEKTSEHQQHFVRNWHPVTCAEAHKRLLRNTLKELLLSIKLSDFSHLQTRKDCNLQGEYLHSRDSQFPYYDLYCSALDVKTGCILINEFHTIQTGWCFEQNVLIIWSVYY